MKRNVRRPRPIKLVAIAAAVALTPVLSSCSLNGFDYATDRPNVIVNGGSGSSGDINVQAARIVAPADGFGTFVSTLSVNQGGEEATLRGLSGVTTGRVEELTLEPGQRANLFVDGGIKVTGDFRAGQVVPVTVTFNSGGEVVDIEVNAIVVTQCHEYEAVSGGKLVLAAAELAGAEKYSCDYAEAAPASESEH